VKVWFKHYAGTQPILHFSSNFLRGLSVQLRFIGLLLNPFCIIISLCYIQAHCINYSEQSAHKISWLLPGRVLRLGMHPDNEFLFGVAIGCKFVYALHALRYAKVLCLHNKFPYQTICTNQFIIKLYLRF